MSEYEFTTDGGNTWLDVKDGGSIVSFVSRPISFRIKPRTIKVNGFDVPAPMSEAPKKGTEYFIASAVSVTMHLTTTWTNEEYDDRVLLRGICHTTKEAAISHTKAMLGIDPNGGEE